MGKMEEGEGQGAQHYYFFLKLHEHCRLLWNAVHAELGNMNWHREDDDAATAARQDKGVSQVGSRQRQLWPGWDPAKQVPQAPLPPAEPAPTASNDVEEEGDNWLAGLADDDDVESGSQSSESLEASTSSHQGAPSKQPRLSAVPSRTGPEVSRLHSVQVPGTLPSGPRKVTSLKGLSVQSTSVSVASPSTTALPVPQQSESPLCKPTKRVPPKTSQRGSRSSKKANNDDGSGFGSSNSPLQAPTTRNGNSTSHTRIPNMETSAADRTSTGKVPRKSRGARGSSSSTQRKRT